MRTLPPGLTKEILHSLTVRHIARYSGMIDRSLRGDRNIRREECKHLLGIWESIRKQGGSLATEVWVYTDDEIREINDAYFDEYGELEE